MIKKLIIQNRSTYDSTGVTFDGFRKFNLIYGTNGTGKSTIAKVINDTTCRDNIQWENKENEDFLLYDDNYLRSMTDAFYSVDSSSDFDSLVRNKIRYESLKVTLSSIEDLIRKDYSESLAYSKVEEMKNINVDDQSDLLYLQGIDAVLFDLDKKFFSLGQNSELSTVSVDNIFETYGELFAEFDSCDDEDSNVVFDRDFVELNNKLLLNLKNVDLLDFYKYAFPYYLWKCIGNEIHIKELDSLLAGIGDGAKYQLLNSCLVKICDELRKKLNGLKLIVQEPYNKVVVDINKTLKANGFIDMEVGVHFRDDNDKLEFSLARVNCVNGILDDGMASLSEGERHFLGFLLFYHKCIGLNSVDGKKKVLVIDDPVTSMDSNVILLVINLIMKLHRSVFVEQIILLTHNSFFFKEFEFFLKNSKGVGIYCLTKQLNIQGQYCTCATPIKSISNFKDDYSLSWNLLFDYLEQIDDYPDNSLRVVLPNLLRRILETYCKFVGYDSGLSLRHLLDNINHRINDDDVRNQIVKFIKSVNRGSHSSLEREEVYTETIDSRDLMNSFEQLFKFIDYAHYLYKKDQWLTPKLSNGCMDENYIKALRDKKKDINKLLRSKESQLKRIPDDKLDRRIVVQNRIDAIRLDLSCIVRELKLIECKQDIDKKLKKCNNFYDENL
ncbi:MAG: AAA family ATPase [Bacteroidales bacterium]|nr:AAA family ATPase [Bacteroidales bacterium]